MRTSPTSPRNWLLVSETFKTLQGEGPSTGVPAFFIRLGSCNQHCNWCDTPYTWVFTDRQASQHSSGAKYDPAKELKRCDIGYLVQQAVESEAPLIVITGGEPMLQDTPLAHLLAAIHERCGELRGYTPDFEIETAGTIDPWPMLAEISQLRAGFDLSLAFNISLKLASSGNDLALRRRPQAIRSFLAGAFGIPLRWKFVVSDKSDLGEINEITEMFGIPPKDVWLMPEGTTQDEVLSKLRWLAEYTIIRGWNLTNRTHIMIWGSARGH